MLGTIINSLAIIAGAYIFIMSPISTKESLLKKRSSSKLCPAIQRLPTLFGSGPKNLQGEILRSSSLVLERIGYSILILSICIMPITLASSELFNFTTV